MVVVSKKVFNGLRPEVKDVYRGCIKKAGLTSSPEKYNLLATSELLQNLRDTNNPFVINMYDALDAMILSTTGFPLRGPVVLDPQGCARQGLLLLMQFEWQGGGLMGSWVQVEVMAIGADGGPVPCMQCLPMMMGVGSYGVTVSNPKLAGEPMKLGLTLFYRQTSVINKETSSRQYMWGKVGKRRKCMRVLFGKDADTYLTLLSSLGIERARGPLLEDGARKEALKTFEGLIDAVTSFETVFAFYLVEVFGVKIWDLVRRVLSLGAVDLFLSDGENRNTFHMCILSEYDKRGEGKSDPYKGNLRRYFNPTIKFFKLGAELMCEKYQKMIFLVDGGAQGQRARLRG